MAKEKNTVEYFPFTVREGRTLYKLKKKHGLEGMGFFIQLFRFLAETPDHYYCIDDEFDRERLVEFIGVDEKKVLKMLETVVETGKIDRELYEKYKIIASKDFIDSLEPVYSKRKTHLMSIEELKLYVIDSGTFRSFPSRDTAESPRQRNKSSQTKLNKTKLNNINHCDKNLSPTVIPVKSDIEKKNDEADKETKKKVTEFFKKATPSQFQTSKDYAREGKFVKELINQSKDISDNPEIQRKWIKEILKAFSDICAGRAGPNHLKGNCILLPSKMMSKGIWPEVVKVMNQEKENKKKAEEIPELKGVDFDSIRLRQ